MVFRNLAGFSVSGLNIPGSRQPWEIKTAWTDLGTKKDIKVAAPLSLVITAVALVASIRNT